MTKETLIQKLKYFSVSDVLDIYIKLFGYGYIYEQLHEFIENADDENIKKLDDIFKNTNN